MEPDSMELKVISCKDLKAFNFFQKLNIYVVVSIVNEDDSTPSPTNNNNNNQKKKHQQQQQQKTPIDRKGNGNPEWNHVMRFDLKHIFSSSSSSVHLLDHCLFLEFDLICEGTILGDKTIGRVRVPFEDLVKEFNGAVRFVSYQVRTTDGIPNGVLDFSFKAINIHNNFVQDNKFGNEFLPPVGNINSGGGADDDVPLVYPPAPSTCYPPPLEGYNPSPVTHYPAAIETHNPSPGSYYPTIEFHNPSPEIHYPTLEIHNPPSEFHNPSPQVYYPPPPQPQPQPQPQVAYYPPPPPFFYPPPPTDPYRVEFGRGNPNPSAYGYPNHWASTPPIRYW